VAVKEAELFPGSAFATKIILGLQPQLLKGMSRTSPDWIEAPYWSQNNRLGLVNESYTVPYEPFSHLFISM